MPCFIHKTGELLLNRRTAVMGILNITPDSFSDGGRYTDVGAAVNRALAMIGEGADILDIGAQSTRPGHAPVTAEEEWRRLRPVLEALRDQITVPVSVDTYYPDVASQAVQAGASIINDVSGSLTNGMCEVAACTGAGLIMMHAGRGADDTGSGADVIGEVRAYFQQALSMARQAGLLPERVCLDPGIGFGKSRQGDLALVAQLPALLERLPDVAVLIGASRKRVIASCCDVLPPVNERLAGTLAIHTVAAWNGAHILRVHDVAAAVQAARVTDALREAASV